MKRIILAASLLAGCTQAQINTAMQTPTGALFCAVQTAGGGAMVVTLVDAEATALTPATSPVAILATGLTKMKVDADCAAAGASMGGVGVAVSPPANVSAVPLVAVVQPK